MEKSFVSISARRRLAWILVAILMSSVIVAGSTFRRTTGVLDRNSSLPAKDSSDLALTIRDSGFDPPDVSRAAGKLLLSVDNRSSVTQINLRLNKEGVHVRDIAVPRDATDWAEEIDLEPGQYELGEVNHPQWITRIAVH